MRHLSRISATDGIPRFFRIVDMDTCDRRGRFTTERTPQFIATCIDVNWPSEIDGKKTAALA